MMCTRWSVRGVSFCSGVVGVAMLVGLATTTLASQAQRLETGVNVIWLPKTPAEQDVEIRQLKAAGVHIVRTGAGTPGTPDEATRNAFIAKLYAAGIKTDLEVHPVYPPDAPSRQPVQGFPGEYPGPPYSAADPKLSEAYFTQLLQKLEAQGVVLAAFELGNEMNGSSYNREFPVPGEGRGFDLNDLEHGDAEARQIAKGYLQYIKIMAALKKARDGSSLNQRTPLLTAGLLSAFTAGPIHASGRFAHLDFVTADATIDFFRKHGMDNYADGYAMHWYGLGPTQAALDASLAKTMSVCAVNGGKPCWITEWGMNEPSQNCPLPDTRRALRFGWAMSDFRKYAAQGKLTAELLFDWGPDDAISNFDTMSVARCGSGVTPAGRIALKP